MRYGADRIRLVTVRHRAEAALRILQRGPAVLSDIERELGLTRSRARYAMRTLIEDSKAHISSREHRVCSDGVSRPMEVYEFGIGELQFKGQTLQLQDVYMHWANTREPEEIVYEVP